MKIALDLDEVLGQFLPALIEYYNDTYKTDWKIEEFYTYYFWEIWGGSVEESIQKVYDFHKTDYFKNIKPVAGAQEAVKKLKENNELFIITSRQNDIIKDTREWVEKYFPNTFTEIYFTNHFSQSGKAITKSEICEKLGIEMLVEDSAPYALECLKPGRKIFLFDYPWNRSAKLPQGIQRVHSWKEITDSIQ